MISLLNYCLNCIIGKNSKYRVSVSTAAELTTLIPRGLTQSFSHKFWGQQFELGLARYSVNLDQGYSHYFIHLVVQPMVNDLKYPHTTLGSWQANN